MIAHNRDDKGGSKDTSEIRSEIERAREQIATSVLELRHQMALNTDWHVWFRRRPALFLGVSFALGFFLGTRKLLPARD
jgi:hypothetical protein